MADREFKIKITGDASGIVGASHEGAEGLRGLGREVENEGVKSLDNEKATHKLTLSKHELHGAVRGLKTEFPELAHVAHMALNPIGLSVAGIVSAFGLWEARVKALESLLGGLVLPDPAERQVGHVNAATKAWEGYELILKRIIETLKSVTAEAERADKAASATVQIQKEILAAQKEAALAELEAARAKMTLEEYLAKKQKTEQDFSGKGTKAEEEARNDEIMRKVAEFSTLKGDAAEKRKQAAGIKVASKEDDAETLKSYADNAKAAQEELKKLEEMRTRWINYSGGEHMSIGDAAKTALETVTLGVHKGGRTPQDVINQLNETIEATKQPIASYNAQQARQAERDRLRQERDNLLKGAAESEGAAAKIETEVPGMESGLSERRAANSRIGAIKELTGLRKESEELHKATAEQARAIRETFERTGIILESSTARLTALNEALARVEAAIKNLEGRTANMR